MRRLLRVVGLSIVFVAAFAANMSAQDDRAGTRSITSDDFASQRPAASKGAPAGQNAGGRKPAKRRASYKYVKKSKTVVRRANPKATAASSAKPEKVSEIGVTMWKMRPSRKTDAGYKLPVLVNDRREMWTAERVDPESAFQPGDRIRLAIEASATGYLYVVNSEIYSDGTFGDPFVIFPASADDDNSVRPGLLVDIPDQSEDLPYFVINPKKDKYEGELLTVIISPKPLTNLKTDKDGRITNLDELIELEVTADAEIYNRMDRQDKIYTESEAGAACGAKARQLTREKSAEDPCGAKTRQLTRDEPLPQTIYRVKTAAGQASVAFIQLKVGA